MSGNSLSDDTGFSPRSMPEKWTGTADATQESICRRLPPIKRQESPDAIGKEARIHIKFSDDVVMIIVKII